MAAAHKGVPWSKKHRQARIDHPQVPWNKGLETGPICDEARRNHSISGKLANKQRPFTEERKQNISKALIGKSKPPENSWKGGKVADDYATILCPAGYVREHRVDYGEPLIPMPYGGLRRQSYRMDFALVDNKVNIEIDGRGHERTIEYDSERDALLRALGWKIIRVKNYTRWS